MHDADRLDRVRRVLRSRASIGRPRRRQLAPVARAWNSRRKPRRWAILCHSDAKWPVSNISTASPGRSVLTSAASQAPVPEAG